LREKKKERQADTRKQTKPARYIETGTMERQRAEAEEGEE